MGGEAAVLIGTIHQVVFVRSLVGMYVTLKTENYQSFISWLYAYLINSVSNMMDVILLAYNKNQGLAGAHARGPHVCWDPESKGPGVGMTLTF